MKGSVNIIVSTKWHRYYFKFRIIITIILVDSATVKTTLIQIINDYLSGRTGPGTEVVCDGKCAVLSGDTESVLARLRLLRNTVIFVDEQEKFLYSKAFAQAVMQSDCYFVFITRDGLGMLPYSVNEIYYLKNSGYYQNTRQIYNSMHQVYPETNTENIRKPSVVLTEDSNAGYELFEAVSQNVKVQCDSAGGKSNVAKYILKNREKRIFAVVDGAAFGADMQSVVHALESSKGSHVWTPESFEYLILQSGIIQAERLGEIMEKPGNYIESSEYCSWERFFTKLLEDLTRNTVYAYSKKKLNPNYLTKGNIGKIEKLMRVMGVYPFIADKKHMEQ